MDWILHGKVKIVLKDESCADYDKTLLDLDHANVEITMPDLDMTTWLREQLRRVSFKHTRKDEKS